MINFIKSLVYKVRAKRDNKKKLRQAMLENLDIISLQAVDENGKRYHSYIKAKDLKAPDSKTKRRNTLKK